MKILIVEDQVDIRKLIMLTLGEQFEVLEAADGQSAIDLVQLHQPALVILDVGLPGNIDGFDVLKAIRRNPQLAAVKVVMLTGRTHEHDYDLAGFHGADRYFVKPFSPLLLVQVIQELL